MDALVWMIRKGAATCDKHAELQMSVSQQEPECAFVFVGHARGHLSFSTASSIPLTSTILRHGQSAVMLLLWLWLLSWLLLCVARSPATSHMHVHFSAATSQKPSVANGSCDIVLMLD